MTPEYIMGKALSRVTEVSEPSSRRNSEADILGMFTSEEDGNCVVVLDFDEIDVGCFVAQEKSIRKPPISSFSHGNRHVTCH